MDQAASHAEHPGRLSDFLREHREEILAAWASEVRKLRAARNLERPLLLDHMPNFLDALAGYVEDLRSGHEVEPPEEFPRIHALERLEVGYDLAEVVSEYSTLRRCITDLAVHSAAPAIRSQELPRLHQAIDQAISTAVVRYTEARERTLRALDRISSAALVHQDVESLLPRTLDAFLETTASVDSVALAMREGEVLRVRAAVGYAGEGPVGTALAAGFAARVEAGGPLFLRCASRDDGAGGDTLCATGIHALYGVPLVMGTQTLGVAVMGSRSSYEFSHEDQFLFRTMVIRVTALIAQARLDAEVRKNSAELEAVIDAIPEAVYVGDAAGIKRANQAALRMLGYDSVEELNRNLGSLAEELQTRHLDGTPLELSGQVFVRALAGESVADELIMRHRGTGKDIVVRSSAAPIRAGGKIIGAVAVNSDITARSQEAEELRAALDFRDRILGVLSHDLRNPLGVILTSASLLQRALTLDDKQKKTLQRVINNGRRIERMIHDLLDYTRTRQGRGIHIAERNADLLGLCHQVIDNMQVLYPERVLRLSAQGHTEARIDPDRGLQVVSNLITNAIKYSPPGSTVQVTVREEPSAVVLEVHNEGKPIPASVLPRLFDAFQRGVADETGQSAGLGLGLYIVQQIVDAHGATISVRSAEGQGTTFSVRWRPARTTLDHSTAPRNP